MHINKALLALALGMALAAATQEDEQVDKNAKQCPDPGEDVRQEPSPEPTQE